MDGGMHMNKESLLMKPLDGIVVCRCRHGWFLFCSHHNICSDIIILGTCIPFWFLEPVILAKSDYFHVLKTEIEVIVGREIKSDSVWDERHEITLDVG